MLVVSLLDIVLVPEAHTHITRIIESDSAIYFKGELGHVVTREPCAINIREDHVIVLTPIALPLGPISPTLFHDDATNLVVDADIDQQIEHDV